MKKHPKILIIGTGSLLNYGCEAIVQGTYNMLQKYWPECVLTVASDDIVYDRKTFQGYTNIEFVPYKKRFTVFRAMMGGLRRIGIGSGSPVPMNTSIAKNYDIILSAGGDNYAEAPDGTLYHILIDLMKIGNIAVKSKRFFVLWGASVGPFNPKNIKRVTKNLEKANLLLPREELSYQYLNRLGLDPERINLVADPAFWMETDESATIHHNNENEIIVGLNVSQLAIAHSYNDQQQGEELLFNSLDELLDSNNQYRYVCIPHVMTDTKGPQDDIHFMKKYIAYSKFKDRISILDFGIGARKTKACIKQCDLLIASRMHCCVAGISTATPTLFLTYSQKGEGMAKYAYGNLDNAINIKNLSGELLKNKVSYLLSNRSVISNHLNEQQSRFRDDAAKAVISLKHLYLSNN